MPQSLGLTGRETFDILGIDDSLTPKQEVKVVATAADGSDDSIHGHGAASIPMSRSNTIATAASLQTVLRKFLN